MKLLENEVLQPKFWLRLSLVSVIAALLATAPRCLGAGSSKAGSPDKPGAVPQTEALPDLIAEALRNNPSVAAARARWEAAKQKVPQATAWEDPMAILNGFLFTSKGFSPKEDGDFSYGLSQKIPFPGKKRLAGTVAEKEAARAYEESQSAAQEVVMGLRQTYADLLLNQKMLDIDLDLRGWVAGAEKAVAEQVATGKAMQSDLLMAQVELALLDRDLANLNDHRADFVATLNRLLGRPLHAGFGQLAESESRTTLAEDEEALRAHALAHRPALRALEREEERAKTAIALARKQQRFPDFDVGAQLFHYSGDGDLREGMLTLSVPLPWWNNRKYRAKVAEEKSNLESAQHDWTDLRNRTWEEIHHARTRLGIARRTFRIYEENVEPKARTAALDDLASYQGSLLDFRRLLDSYRTWKYSELERYQALSAALKAQAELDALVGAPLPQAANAKVGEHK